MEGLAQAERLYDSRLPNDADPDEIEEIDDTDNKRDAPIRESIKSSKKLSKN